MACVSCHASFHSAASAATASTANTTLRRLWLTTLMAFKRSNVYQCIRRGRWRNPPDSKEPSLGAADPQVPQCGRPGRGSFNGGTSKLHGVGKAGLGTSADGAKLVC